MHEHKPVPYRSRTRPNGDRVEDCRCGWFRVNGGAWERTEPPNEDDEDADAPDAALATLDYRYFNSK